MTTQLAEQLSGTRLFNQIEMAQVMHLLGSCARHQLAPGDALIEAGARNNTLYVVISGQLRVYAGGHDTPANAMLGAGDCAGELSMIDGERSAALVLAAEPTELLAIPHERMWEMIDVVPALARNLLAIMSGRVRENNLTLVTTQSRTLEFEQASSVDPLTGLHNRRWIDDAFMRLIRRCRKDAASICLIIADLDLISRINDRNGFLTGDNVLRRAARSLAEALRPQDLIGRFGGDEFIVLVPYTSIAEALVIGARLCSVVRDADIHVPPDRAPMTISCGIAAVRPEDDLMTTFARAEQALQKAKDKGRNRPEALL